MKRPEGVNAKQPNRQFLLSFSELGFSDALWEDRCRWCGDPIKPAGTSLRIEGVPLAAFIKTRNDVDVGGTARDGTHLLDAVFIDLETTGLGGSATMAFLLGLGKLEPDGRGILVKQYFIEDPSEEAACLESYVKDLAESRLVITFNGNAFDLPILETRAVLCKLAHVLQGLRRVATLDLLPVARALWGIRQKSRGLSCGLASLGATILGLDRGPDIPSWAIPGMYFDYLRTRDMGSLEPVFRHNAMDIASMALLLVRAVSELGRPSSFMEAYGAAKIYMRNGEVDAALSYLLAVAEEGLSRREADFTLQYLTTRSLVLASRALKRRRNWEPLLALLEKAACCDNLEPRARIFAHQEMAKFYEHVAGDPERALALAQAALDLWERDRSGRFWTDALLKRRERLMRKIARAE